ncbi:hypothetical protein Tco_1536948 [Tanacetum coccineum]
MGSNPTCHLLGLLVPLPRGPLRRRSDGGLRWSTIVDRRRPPLTGGSCGGFVDGSRTDGRLRGTTQVVTRGKLMIELLVRGTVAGLGTWLQVLVRGEGSVVGLEGWLGHPSQQRNVLGAYVEAIDWWIYVMIVWQQLCTRTHSPSQSLAFNEAAGIVKGPKYPCFLGSDWLAQRMDKNTPQGFGL